MAEVVELWLASRKTPTPASIKRYTDSIDNYVLPRWGSTKLSKVTRPDLDRWVSDLATGSAPVAEGMIPAPLAPATIKAVWVPLRASLAYAKRSGWLRIDPSEGIELPRADREDDGLVKALAYAQLSALEEAAEGVAGNVSDRIMVTFMGTTGARIGEAAALRVGHLNLEKKRARISSTVTIDLQGTPVIGKAKHGSIREVPLTVSLVSELKLLTKGRKAEEPVLTSASGGALSVANWRNRVWSKAIRVAGLDAFGFTPPQPPSHRGVSCDCSRGRRARRRADAGPQRREDDAERVRPPLPGQAGRGCRGDGVGQDESTD
ncbi:tyrosine-type recombinase/integrase [Rathayibacter agropyri]|nr:tyrosine-type recombinase/integrase [Rathayibacter agropyri]